jgi:hypothetical protein
MVETPGGEDAFEAFFVDDDADDFGEGRCRAGNRGGGPFFHCRTFVEAWRDEADGINVLKARVDEFAR